VNLTLDASIAKKAHSLDFGKSLQPILLQMRDWGQEYMQTLVEKKRRVPA
jgi:DNA-binding HxlR family transcriptional regulator